MQGKRAVVQAWFWLGGPLAMGVSTVLVVSRATAWPLSPAGVTLFLAGVMTAYTFDRWIECAPGRRPAWTLVAAIAGALVGLGAATALPAAKVGLAVALGVVGLGYRELKKLPLLKTAIIAVAWPVAAVSFSLAPGAPLERTAPVALALTALFAAGALLCDFKDIAADARAGVRTAPVLWGAGATAAVAAGLALLGVALALGMGRHGLVCAGLALAGLAMCPRVVSRPLLGPILVDGALALPAVLILTGWA
jgi:hypothetical protein